MSRAFPIMSSPIHNLSASAALVAAETACQAHGMCLTPTLKATLQTLWEAGRPLGAYEVLNHMEEKLDRRLLPPTIYRALDFLLEQRLISRIEGRKAFVPCAHPGHPHACVFFICENCGASEEIEDRILEKLFDRKAVSLGFRISKRVVELQGMCANCLGAPERVSAPTL